MNIRITIFLFCTLSALVSFTQVFAGDTTFHSPNPNLQDSSRIDLFEWSPEKNYIVTVDTEAATMCLYETANFTLDNKIVTNSKITALALASDNDGLMLLSGHEDGVINIWDSAGELLSSINAHKDAVLDLEVSPNGNLLASSGLDNIINLWDTSNWNLAEQIDVYAFHFEQVLFSPNGKILALTQSNYREILSVDDALRLGVIWLWDIEQQKEIDILSIDFNARTTFIREVQFTPDGEFLMGASADTHLIVWRLEIGTVIFKASPSFMTVTSSLDFSIDNTILAVGGSEIRLFSVDNEEGFKTSLDTVLIEQDQRTTDIKFNPSGDYLGVLSNGEVKILDIETNEFTATITGCE